MLTARFYSHQVDGSVSASFLVFGETIAEICKHEDPGAWDVALVRDERTGVLTMYEPDELELRPALIDYKGDEYLFPVVDIGLQRAFEGSLLESTRNLNASGKSREVEVQGFRYRFDPSAQEIQIAITQPLDGAAKFVLALLLQNHTKRRARYSFGQRQVLLSFPLSDTQLALLGLPKGE